MGKLEIYKYLFLLNSFFLYFRNQALLSYIKARIHFSFPHVTPTVNVLFSYFLMNFRRCPVSHVNQSRAVLTLEDWVSHGKA